MTDEEAIQARIDAWRAFATYRHERFDPRFYKQKVGRKVQLVNPWRSLPERIEVENKCRELYDAWFAAHLECARRGYPFMGNAIFDEWKKIETPQGERWVKQ